jgi:hypothetical protein
MALCGLMSFPLVRPSYKSFVFVIHNLFCCADTYLFVFIPVFFFSFLLLQQQLLLVFVFLTLSCEIKCLPPYKVVLRKQYIIRVILRKERKK